MPINVHHQYVERSIVCVKFLDELFKFLVRVGPVTRPPRTERKAWRQWNFSCDPREVIKGAFVIVPIAEKVPILPIACGTQHHPRPWTLLPLREGKVG